MKGLDWSEGVLVGESTLSVRRTPTGWFEVCRNGEGLQSFGDERTANQRALMLLQALQPDGRPTCLICGRPVGLNNRGRLAPHNADVKRGARPCPGTGLKVSQQLKPQQ